MSTKLNFYTPLLIYIYRINSVLLKNFIICRLYVRNFWSHEKRLSTATLERMLTVLRSLYSGQIERCFLSLATNLLLEMTSQSPDFKRDMFEFPLSECTFQVSSTSIATRFLLVCN